jgi:signal transduction histidine kinase
MCSAGQRSNRVKVAASLRLALCVLVVCLASGASAVLPAAAGAGAAHDPGFEVGQPLFRNFIPRAYGARPQNWAVVQDHRGVIYVGNGDGVLEFDGVRWRLIRVSNGTSVRSLAVDAAGRVHVGAIGEFGVLQPDARGELQYVSLLARIAPADREFTDVRRLFIDDDGLHVYSDQRLFRVRADRVDVFRPQNEFTLAFKVGSRMFVHEDGRGLIERVDDVLRPVPQGARFANTRVQLMLSDGDDGSVLIGTRNEGMFRYDGSTMRPFATEIDTELKRDQLYAGIRLPDGRLLLATLQGGLFVLDAAGQLRAQLRKSDGLIDDTAYALTNDREGGIWLALDRGIARVELAHPLSLFDERSGLDGSLLSLHRHQGRLFAGTNHGLFVLIPGPRPRFDAIPGIVGQVWDLLSIGDTLWIANSSGVHVLQAGQVLPLRPSSQHALAMHVVGSPPQRVFIGMLRGLASMRLEQGRWLDEGPVDGIKDQVRSLWVAADGTLWAGTRATGVLRLGIPPGWRGSADDVPPVITRFGLADGLPDLNHTEVQPFGADALFLTHQGLFRFNATQQRFAPDPHFADLFPGGPRWVQPLLVRADQSIWAGTNDEHNGLSETGHMRLQDDGRYHWDARALQAISGNTTGVIHDDGGDVLWFGGPFGLVRHQLTAAKDYSGSFHTLLRRVVAGDGRIVHGGGGELAPPRLAYADNALRFEYAATSFDGLDANRFQVLLEGVDRDWSEWRADGYKDYNNLFEGDYRFQVRARNLYGTTSAPATFNFRVLPPWYRSGFAYLGYLSGVVALVASLLRWRLGRLQAKRIALEQIVAERTHQLATLGDIGREVMAQLDLDAALETLYLHLRRVLDASVFGVGLHHPESGEIEFRIAYENGQRYPPYVRRMDDKNQLAVWCIEQRQAILIGDYAEEYRRYLAEPDRRTVTLADGSVSRIPSSVMYAPLLRKDQVLGVIGVQSFKAHAYDNSHLDILQTLATYTASAVEHAHEHQKLARSHDELSATHQRLVETQQQLVVQEKMASLGQLVAGVAHEINTPLGVALTASSHLGQRARAFVGTLAERTLSPAELAAFADEAALATRMVETNLDRAVKLVRSFKQVSVDRTNDDRRTFDLVSYLNDLVQSLEPSWKRRPITLRLECPDSIRMDGFPGALGQVVTNLIQNALQHAFAAEASGAMTLQVRAPDGSRIEIVFADDGRGIAREHLPRIFDPFFTTQRGAGGTGLGLHITFNLVTQKLGGRIDVESEPGRGTRFRIVMPRVAPR